MGKLVKYLLGLVLILLMLVAAAVVVAPLVVDPNDFRDEIVAEVKKRTGLDLTIRGDIDLSVFPWLGVELGALSLNQPPGYGEAPFAAVGHAQVKAKLLPLLEKRVEVDRVVLDGLRLNLVRNAQGAGNWEELARAGAATRERPGASAAEQPAEQGSGLAALAIGGVQVADARVSWDDRRSGQQVTVRDLRLETGEIIPGRPLDLELGFAVDNKAPDLSARVGLSGRVTAAADGRHVRVEPFELRLEDVQTGTGVAANLELGAVLDLDLEAGQYRLDGLKLEADARGGQLAGGALRAVLQAAVRADLAQEILTLDGLKLEVDAKGEQVPGGALRGVLQASARADLAKETLTLDGLDMQAAGLHLTGQLTGTRIKSDPSFQGRLSLAQLSPRELMQHLGMQAPKTADAEVLKRLSLSSELRATARQLSLDKLEMVLDDSTLSGDARILLTQPPGYRFALQLDAIDLDRYLPPRPEKAAETPAAKAPAGAGPEQPLFPVELLRGLDIDGSFRVGHLVVNRLKLDQARITVKAKEGDLKIDQKVGAFYQGNLAGSIGVDVRGKTPRLRLAQHAVNIQAEPLVQDLAGQDRLSGLGNFDLDVTGSGQSVAAVKRTLDGRLGFAFTDGAVKGVDLGRLLRTAAARLKGQPLPPDDTPQQTDFTELGASAVIAKGILKSEDLSAKSPLFRVTGKGIVDIGGDTLDYRIKPVLVASVEGQGGAELDKLKGVPIPVHITGPLTKPAWRIDLAEAFTESQKARLKETVHKKLEEVIPEGIKEKLPGGLGNALKGLF